MKPVTRRQFVQSAAACTLGAASLCRPQSNAVAALIEQGKGKLRIAEIETHEVLPPVAEENFTWLFRYHGVGLQLRTIYVVRTDNGLTGYGENWGRPYLKPEQIAQYIDTDPFDWIGDLDNLPINMAVYDLMGKFLDLPAWKLLGPKVRERIPVAAWTVSQPPAAMAEQVRQAVGLGYRWLKYHVDEIQNVVDQTAAMQQVAPDGFRVHYDFNANSTFEAVYPVLQELERFPVVGRIEDPIVAGDRDGWRRLCELVSPEILVHHGPVDFMIDRLCDGLMAGHAAVGQAQKIAAVAESTNTPFMLQQCGGTINQAFLAHEAAVFNMATIDHVSLANVWTDDVTVRTMPVVDGTVEVPSGPGLGVELDHEKLARYKAAPRPEYGRFLVRIRYGGGPTIYARHNADLPGATDSLRFLKRLLGEPVPGPVPSYGNAVASDFWDDDGDAEFERVWKETEAGPVVEDSEPQSP